MEAKGLFHTSPVGLRVCPLVRYLVRPVNELIDAGDPRAKVVGKRRPPVTSVAEATVAVDRLQRQMARIWGVLPFPSGVHRFKDWEEAEAWKTDRMMRKSPVRR